MRFDSIGSRLWVRAPAKLNLFLEVSGKRSDGYHELETVMVAIDLCDRVCLADRSDGRVSVKPFDATTGRLSIPWDDDNLVVRAARRLQEKIGCRRGCDIQLEKRTPADSGLGGGSSDAAATLAGLARLWKLDVSHRDLHDIAAELGSDINFFVESVEAAICRGRGEIVEPISVNGPLHFVVVRPVSGLSTASVFSELEIGQQTASAHPVVLALRDGNHGRLARSLLNRLQPAAVRQNRDLANLVQRFGVLRPHGFQMSGSGTACFALCRNRREARRLAARVKSTSQNASVFVARSCAM